MIKNRAAFLILAINSVYPTATFAVSPCDCLPQFCNGNPPKCGPRRVTENLYKFSTKALSKEKLMQALDDAKSSLQNQKIK